MINFESKAAAVADMHERGYTNDFRLFGNNLLWVQEKLFIRKDQFSITEFYQFINPIKPVTNEIVFGVVSDYYQVKGILINDYSCYTLRTPPVIIEKLIENNFFIVQ